MDFNKKLLRIKKKSIVLIDRLNFAIFRNRLRYLFEFEIVEEIAKNCKVVSAEKTLEELEKTLIAQSHGMYMRFGDGDVFLMKNKSDSYQENSEKLAAEMKESFSLNDEGIFKCLAIHSERFGYSDGMTIGNHKNNDHFASKLFRDSYKYFCGSKIYSPVALHFMATSNTAKANGFLKILKSKTTIFIGNEDVGHNTVELLFGRKTIHVKTPSKNAYSLIDTIEREVTELIEAKNDYFVICIAMGCSGRPLMKRLWKKNKHQKFFLFDFGSLLDGIQGTNSRTWLKVNTINYKELLNGLHTIE